MSQVTAEAAYGLKEAAELKGVSIDTLKKAIHATEGPVLKAKRVGNRYRIGARALDDWFESLPDA